MVLSIHGESTDISVDIFDREASFIENTLKQLIDDFPKLKIVLEHISTKEAVDFVMSHNIAATITPQHLLFNRNSTDNNIRHRITIKWYQTPLLLSSHFEIRMP